MYSDIFGQRFFLGIGGYKRLKTSELYGHLLGLEWPWFVDRVDIDELSGRVDIFVCSIPGKRLRCPLCNRLGTVYDHLKERMWRELDSVGYLTFIHCSPPRILCIKHGVKQALLPWGDRYMRYTRNFIGNFKKITKSSNIRAASILLGISWDEASMILDKIIVAASSGASKDGRNLKNGDSAEAKLIRLIVSELQNNLSGTMSA
ncbi:MAG: hypothetical protein M1533_06485 [Candidatus Thermoplasmatota archaeon]|nr:hypothetical protein [Candidatus Thermoplasmatota archaeon]